MAESLELRLAQSQIEHFEVDCDRLMQDHYEAEDSFHCERFLQCGINAYEWLQRAEQSLTLADAEGILEYSADLQEAVRTLYHRWLGPCKLADEWTSRVEKNGYTIDNLQAFRDCCEAVQDWIERDEWHSVASAARNERFAEGD